MHSMSSFCQTNKPTEAHVLNPFVKMNKTKVPLYNMAVLHMKERDRERDRSLSS